MLALNKQLDFTLMLLYWIMQIIGGLLSGCAFCYIFDNGYGVDPGSGYSLDIAVLVEVLYTAMLCFAVAHSACSKANNPEDDGNQFFALAIGFVIVAGGYAAASISGANFNPAVSLGLSASYSMLHGSEAWFNGVLWSGFQLVGAAIAAALFRVMRPREVMEKSSSNATMNSREDSDGEAPFMVKCLSEFLGVFILTMTVGLNIITKSSATALSAAGALISLIYSLGYISGAHLNPAVTLAIVLSGRNKCAPHVGVVYALVQILGALLAGHLYAGFHINGPNKAESFPLAPGKGYTFEVAGMSELFFTFVLAYTVLAVATVSQPMLKKTTQCFYHGLAIAACVIAGGFAIGGVSGGVLNPAVSLGISVATLAKETPDHQSVLVNFFPFSLWQLSGGIIAAVAFRATHSSEYVQRNTGMIKGV
jgi:aquaporin Z